jgi:UPF0755 protein
VRAGLVLLLVAVCAAAVCGSLFLPVSSVYRPVQVRIPRSATASRIAALLHRHRIIRSAWAYDIYLHVLRRGDRFRAGLYTLSPNMTLAQITTDLENGGTRDDRIRVTIPEGYTLPQIAAALEEKGVTKASAFMKLAHNPAAFSDVPLDFPMPHRTLEGYLFPDTYPFDPSTPPEKVIRTMLLNFSSRFVRPYQHDIGASGRNVHEIVTLASLVEREALIPADRARIAGVLDNRLRRGIPLAVDATVLYALGHHKDRVLYADLKVNSPYNTYKHKGLPPGPIASPGLASLEAALHPEKNDYLFYVAMPNGAHVFSATAREHEAAKSQARAERQRPGGNANPRG